MLREREKGLPAPGTHCVGDGPISLLLKEPPALRSTYHMAPIPLGTLSETEVTVFHNLLSEVTSHHLGPLPFSRWDSLGPATFKAR